MKKLTLLFLSFFSLHYNDSLAMNAAPDTVIYMNSFHADQIPDQTERTTTNFVMDMSPLANSTPDIPGTTSLLSPHRQQETPRSAMRTLAHDIVQTVDQGGKEIIEKVDLGGQQIVNIAQSTHETLTQVQECLEKMEKAQEEQRKLQQKQWFANRVSLGITALGACSLIVNFIMQRQQER